MNEQVEKNDFPETLCQEYWEEHTGEKRCRTWKSKLMLGKGIKSTMVLEVKSADEDGTVAAKCVCKKDLSTAKSREFLRNEIRVLRSCDHPHILKFFQYFETDEMYILLTEMCSNCSLDTVLKTRKHLTEPEVRYYGLQILGGMKYLKDNWILHRDLKPGNLLLNHEMQVKIGDFGLARQLSFRSDTEWLVCGTPNYVAPEILVAKTSQVGYSFSVDVWALGCCFYAFLLYTPPFNTSNTLKTYAKIKKADFSYPDYPKISPLVKNLISNILDVDVDTRFDLKQVQSHAFFTDSSLFTPTVLPPTATLMEPKFSTK